MKIALCTTTINIPHVLKLYRACDADVRFIIASDRKTPDFPRDLMDAIVPTTYVTTDDQEEWACSKLIPWDCIQRRNMAFLEALKWGADVIVSVDDDNIVLGDDYFRQFKDAFAKPFTGVAASGAWFDPGSLLMPSIKQRGIPYGVDTTARYEPVTGAKIGVVAGIATGDADMDAVTRMASGPEAVSLTLPGQRGIVVEHATHTVFNSQVTAVARELIPAWGMLPFCGRFDDIFASMICRRVMRERDLYVRFGPPAVWQTRNPHNLTRDLRGEVDGYDNVEQLAEVLDHIPLLGKSVIDDCRTIWSTLNHVMWMPGRTVAAMMAYIDDAERVL